MSRKDDCRENAPMESFIGTLINEYLHHHKFKTRAKARRDTFDYIEVFYYRNRRHAKLSNQVPAEFAKAYYEKISVKCCIVIIVALP